MAKAKKTTSDSAAAKTPAKKGGKAKVAEKQAASSTPVFNVALAANAAAAAKLVAHRAKAGEADAGAVDQKDSNSFKDFKSSINKPSGPSTSGPLSNVPGSRQSNLPYGANKQVAHNQTFGNVNSKGVPRRTAG